MLFGLWVWMEMGKWHGNQKWTLKNGIEHAPQKSQDFMWDIFWIWGSNSESKGSQHGMAITGELEGDGTSIEVAERNVENIQFLSCREVSPLTWSFSNNDEDLEHFALKMSATGWRDTPVQISVWITRKSDDSGYQASSAAQHYHSNFAQQGAHQISNFLYLYPCNPWVSWYFVSFGVWHHARLARHVDEAREVHL